MVVEAGGHDVPVVVPVEPRTLNALQHVAALHGHDRGCPLQTSSQVGVLARSLHAAQAVPLCVIVRPGDDPAFWLRLAGDRGPTDVRLGVLDAVALLLSEQFPVALEVPDDDPWERTLQALIADRDT